jgi:hypothetical protein
MPMGYELVQLMAEYVPVVWGVRPICHTIHQVPEASQQDKNQEQQENRAEIIKSQRRGQNIKQSSHITNLLYEAPKPLLPITIIASVLGLSQDNLSAKCPEKCGAGLTAIEMGRNGLLLQRFVQQPLMKSLFLLNPWLAPAYLESRQDTEAQEGESMDRGRFYVRGGWSSLLSRHHRRPHDVVSRCQIYILQHICHSTTVFIYMYVLYIV